jgi:hypothetical protein
MRTAFKERMKNNRLNIGGNNGKKKRRMYNGTDAETITATEEAAQNQRWW